VSKHTAGTPGPADLLTLNRAATVARLLSSLIHEVNNALQIIGGNTELLRGMPDLPEPVATGLRRIAAQNNRTATTVLELQMFARPSAAAESRTSLLEIAKQSMALRSFAIGRARLSIALDAPSTGRVFVLGNAGNLQLAVLNLIVNAEQALAGQKGGAIRVSVTESPGFVGLSVSDNGPGVGDAAAEELFEPFFTTRSRDEASGLGLSVARLIAEQHGGTLRLIPQDAGACFEMRLPAAG
jgi:signal transduction histidine kinase